MFFARQLRLALVIVTAVLLCGCKDPPTDGQLVLYIDRTAVGQNVSSVSLTVERVLLFYDTPPAAPMHMGTTCLAPAAHSLTFTPISEVIDTTMTGDVFVGAMNAPAGNLAEIRLLVDNPATVTEHSLERPLHPDVNCDDLNEDGLIRLVPTGTASIKIQTNTLTQIAAQFDPNRDVVHDDPNSVPGGNGDLHGGRWSIASSLNAVVIPPDDGTIIIPDEVVVRFKDGTSVAQIQADATARGATIIRSWPATNYYTFKLPNGANLQQEIEYYDGLSEADFALPNNRLQYNAIPNDPQIGAQQMAYLDEISAPAAWDHGTGSYSVIVAVTDSAFELSNPDLVDNFFINKAEIPPAALVQEGLTDFNHDGTVNADDLDADGDGFITFADLKARNVCGAASSAAQCNPLALLDGKGTTCKLCGGANHDVPPTDCSLGYGWQDGCDNDCNGFCDDLVGWNFGDNSNNPRYQMPGALTFHGTNTSAFVGAVGNNGLGGSGISWKVRILPLSVLLRDTIIQGWNYAGMMHADVISASVGFFSYLQGTDIHGCSPEAIGNTDTSGTLPINLSQDKFNAEKDRLQREFKDAVRLNGALLVNAAGNCQFNLDDDAHVIEWPSYVNTSGLRVAASSSGSLTDFSAYGSSSVDIAAPGYLLPEILDNGSLGGPISGTSFATPIVAGSAALLIGTDSSLRGNPCAVADRILRNADQLSPLQGQLVSGGRLNAAAAVLNTNTTPLRSCP